MHDHAQAVIVSYFPTTAPAAALAQGYSNTLSYRFTVELLPVLDAADSS